MNKNTLEFNLTNLISNYWIPFLYCFLGFILIILNTYNYGVNLSPDSINYIKSARSILDHPMFLLKDNSALVIWPPGYPLLLSLMGLLTNSDPLKIIPFLNAALFSLFLVCSFYLIIKAINSKFIAFLILALLISTNRVIDLFCCAWSEPLFISLISVALICLIKYFKELNIKYLLHFSVLAALICLTRYIGVSFIFFGFISIMFLHRQSKSNKYLHIFIFLLISSLPILLWFFRNYLLTETIAGIRPSGEVNIDKNIISTLVVFKQLLFSFGKIETFVKGLIFTVFNLLIFITTVR